MNKVIITRENYEEVMFNLLENTYPRNVRENILDQIQADTFLSFEWQQWSKAVYSESTEQIKDKEAAFIENLTRDEGNRTGYIRYLFPLSLAASVVLFLGIFITLQRTDNGTLSGSLAANEQTKATKKQVENIPGHTSDAGAHTTPAQPEKAQMPSGEADKISLAGTETGSPADTSVNKPVPQQQDPVRQMLADATMDTLRQMMSAPVKKSRFRVSITESSFEDPVAMLFEFSEKRYTMADVLNRKDGITLSKFLENPRTKIIKDKTNNTTYIEYMAADMSVLILPLAH